LPLSAKKNTSVTQLILDRQTVQVLLLGLALRSSLRLQLQRGKPQVRMFSPFPCLHSLLLLTACLLLVGQSATAQEAKNIPVLGAVKGADAQRVKRVLILHSFGRNFAPFTAVSSTFRAELARQSAAPIEFLEASLEATMFAEAGSEAPLVEYLRALFTKRAADLVVPIGAPAMFFLQRHSDILFRGVPMLVVAADKRRVNDLNLGANATAFGISLDLPGIVDNILRILPKTTNVEVVTGNSPFERFWQMEFQRDSQRLNYRVHFDWLNELSFEEIERRLSRLPPNSAIVYFLMVVDAAGVPYEQERALDVLRRNSNAPIFGIFDHQLGRGIVGGPLSPYQEVSRESARIALRILNGTPANSIKPVFLGPAAEYDWRELKRWGIDESRLPQGSIIRFRSPSVWEQYRWYIFGTFAIITVQALLIVGLLLHRARRRQAEAELRESQEFMELSTSSAELGLWVRDLKRGDLWVNPRLRSLFGFSQNDALRFEDVINRIHPDDRARVIVEIKRTEQTGLAFEGEFRVVSADGSERWVAVRGRAADEPGSDAARRVGVVFDVTARKRAEQDLNAALVEIRDLKDRLEEENIYLKEEISEVKGFDEIVGESDGLKYVLTRVEQVAKTDATVLLLGETGVGKELIARAIHEKSSRSEAPYIKVNCATLPEALVEGELFGHEKGAFTGADRQRKGRFELADGGTILLDEVGELPLDTQAKLLRVLEEGEFERVGGSNTIKVSVRIIAATNRKLHGEVSAGGFRQDLFYRLNVYPITVPPLRQRPEDIPQLVSHFARQIGERMGKSISEVPAQVMREFTEYSWPGNIRELQNVIERAVIISSDGVLRLLEPLGQVTNAPASETETSNESLTVASLGEAEREHILRAFGSHGVAYQRAQGRSRYAQASSLYLEIPHEKTRRDESRGLYAAAREIKIALTIE
jgi:PAS domain S-box-containing protein